MKYRRITAEGDYAFGFGNTSFVTDIDAVRQAIQTKLKLFQGEFWEDLNDGLPFFQQIAGTTSKDSIDLLIRARILSTPQVIEISSFQSSIGVDRKYKATVGVNTVYGSLTVGVD